MNLVRYDAARHALQQAVAVDEVKDIRDKAQAMAAYAKQAKDTELVEWATEIKVRAERRAGQMLAEMPKNNGQLLRGSIVRPREESKTLDEIGISKTQSSRWQKLAAVPDDQFEQAVTAAKEVAGEVTTAAMLRIEKANNPPKPTILKPETVEEPEEIPECDEKDMLIDSLNTVIEQLSNENDRLKNQLASGIVPADDQEKFHKRLSELTSENKKLKNINKGLSANLDSLMVKNNELQKQCERTQNKLKAMSK